MSRTEANISNRIKSPLKYYFEFGGAEGIWAYWDGEKNVRVDSLEFVVMDTRSSIGGWSDVNSGRINSNMVKSTKASPFTVRCGKTVMAEGFYADIKADIVAAGGKFVTNILAMAKIDDNWVPVDIQLSGACLRDWTAFVEKCGNIFEVYKGSVSAARGEQQKKGSVKYYTPDFVLSDLSEDVEAAADLFCTETLMPYLNQ